MSFNTYSVTSSDHSGSYTCTRTNGQFMFSTNRNHRTDYITLTQLIELIGSHAGRRVVKHQSERTGNLYVFDRRQLINWIDSLIR